MSKNRQILVRNPCGESWETMSPSGNGRFCGSCQKTVVDFTNMSDSEVLAWLADANKKVCGRFDANQLNRRLVPLPERKRKAWVIWQFILAGLLISSKAESQKAPGVGTTQCDKKPLGEPRMGKVGVRSDTSKTDTPRFTNLPSFVVQGWATIRRSDIMGDTVLYTEDIRKKKKKTRAVLPDLVKDTLAILGLAKKELSLYPNPAVRGTAVRYTLPSKFSGEAKLELFDSGGALLEEQVINNTQTEIVNIPASLAAGIYFVKVSPAGPGKTFTQKLVVL